MASPRAGSWIAKNLQDFLVYWQFNLKRQGLTLNFETMGKEVALRPSFLFILYSPRVWPQSHSSLSSQSLSASLCKLGIYNCYLPGLWQYYKRKSYQRWRSRGQEKEEQEGKKEEEEKEEKKEEEKEKAQKREKEEEVEGSSNPFPSVSGTQ